MYTKLPKIESGVAVINNDIVDADVTLSGGKITILDTDANLGLKFKVSDGISVEKTAYSAGVKSEKTVNFSAVTLVANTNYSMTITLPNRQAFFGGGQESDTVFKTRTYTVSTDATPTVTKLRDSFLQAIQNDLNSGVVASDVSTDRILIIMEDVNSGDTDIVAPIGAVIVNTVVYVAPSGTPEEVKLYVSGSLVVVNGEYTKYVVTYRKDIRSNIVNGNFVIKQEKAILFIEENATAFASATAILDSIIDGTYTPVADFLGI